MNLYKTSIILDPMDPRLHVPSKKVKDPSHPDTILLAQRLTELIVQTPRCVGLAAPQIGVNLRLCVVNYNGQLLALVNPRIVKTGEEELGPNGGIDWSEEGCMSHPGVTVEVGRPKLILFAFYALGSSTEQVAKAQGFIARIVQHEIAHLDGRLITDEPHRRNVLLNQPGQEVLFREQAKNLESGYQAPEI